jgi:EpsD family peptidyl-prolyl cis-trans isomerase
MNSGGSDVMKKTYVPMALATAAALALAGCSKEAKAPEGQVVATVDGTDVTIHEVNAEIGGMGPQAQAAPRKLVEAVALSRVVERKMLAAEARTRKLDQSPQFVLAKARADENLLVQALQADVASKVLQTPREAAQKFISDNAIMFADRRIMTLDQIQFLRSAKVASLPLKDAKSMQEVERLLLEQNIEYRRAPQQIDTLVLDPRLSKEFVAMNRGPGGEPFMYTDQPQGAPAPVVYVNVVSEMKTDPFLGEKAITYAQQVIQRQEVGKKLQAELTRLREANKAKISYAKGYDAPDKVAASLEKAAAAGAAKPAAPAAAPAAPAAK